MSDELSTGDDGKAVRDLQARLARLGHTVSVTGRYDADTEHAVRVFQISRGLRETGRVERETWQVLLEAGYALGDRLLYHRRPMLRGDDIAEVQRRCNALGFDSGREDGIYGPATERAIRDFQLNAGLAADGVVGAQTCLALVRLGALSAGSVAGVREREELRASTRRLAGCRVFVAVDPGMDVLAEQLARELAVVGGEPLVDRSGADAVDLAATANEFGADVALWFQYATSAGPRCTYFANQRYRSEAGHAIATAVDRALEPVLGAARPAEGRTFAFLRETQMAAVVCEPVPVDDVGAMRTFVAAVHDVAAAIIDGLRAGVELPHSEIVAASTD